MARFLSLSNLGTNDVNSPCSSTSTPTGSCTSSIPPRRPRVFVCKTCNREFSSFQALGGHRASHRKPGLEIGASCANHILHSQNSSLKQMPKTSHECSICGLDFPIGQALGGHMRRHRINAAPPPPTPTTSSQGLKNNHVDVVDPISPGVEAQVEDFAGVDLNLTPLENDLIRLELMAPGVHFYS